MNSSQSLVAESLYNNKDEIIYFLEERNGMMYFCSSFGMIHYAAIFIKIRKEDFNIPIDRRKKYYVWELVDYVKNDDVRIYFRNIICPTNYNIEHMMEQMEDILPEDYCWTTRKHVKKYKNVFEMHKRINVIITDKFRGEGFEIGGLVKAFFKDVIACNIDNIVAERAFVFEFLDYENGKWSVTRDDFEFRCYVPFSNKVVIDNEREYEIPDYSTREGNLFENILKHSFGNRMCMTERVSEICRQYQSVFENYFVDRFLSEIENISPEMVKFIRAHEHLIVGVEMKKSPLSSINDFINDVMAGNIHKNIFMEKDFRDIDEMFRMGLENDQYAIWLLFPVAYEYHARMFHKIPRALWRYVDNAFLGYQIKDKNDISKKDALFLEIMNYLLDHFYLETKDELKLLVVVCELIVALYAINEKTSWQSACFLKGGKKKKSLSDAIRNYSALKDLRNQEMEALIDELRDYVALLNSNAYFTNNVFSLKNFRKVLKELDRKVNEMKKKLIDEQDIMDVVVQEKMVDVEIDGIRVEIMETVRDFFDDGKKNNNCLAIQISYVFYYPPSRYFRLTDRNGVMSHAKLIYEDFGVVIDQHNSVPPERHAEVLREFVDGLDAEAMEKIFKTLPLNMDPAKKNFLKNYTLLSSKFYSDSIKDMFIDKFTDENKTYFHERYERAFEKYVKEHPTKSKILMSMTNKS